MSKLNISVSPHIRSGLTTQKIMLDVIIALMPALVASVYFFGVRALLITAVCVLSALIGEIVFEMITKRDITITDLSAIVTGLLLSFNLPVTIPAWQAMIGSFVAIVVVKQLFGGIGYNFANPAITARVMMFISFSDSMSKFVAPHPTQIIETSATPLAIENKEELPSLLDMFIGERAGSLGETCAIALLIGFVYLIVRRVITWHIPVVFVGTVFVLSLCFGGFDLTAATYQVLSGGLLLGAIFMATDYVTSPPTPLGKVIFALGCGIITFAIRHWGAYPEGVSFSILFMNVLTPYIAKLTAHRPFGAAKPEKEA